MVLKIQIKPSAGPQEDTRTCTCMSACIVSWARVDVLQNPHVHCVSVSSSLSVSRYTFIRVCAFMYMCVFVHIRMCTLHVPVYICLYWVLSAHLCGGVTTSVNAYEHMG